MPLRCICLIGLLVIRPCAAGLSNSELHKATIYLARVNFPNWYCNWYFAKLPRYFLRTLLEGFAQLEDKANYSPNGDKIFEMFASIKCIPPHFNAAAIDEMWEFFGADYLEYPGSYFDNWITIPKELQPIVKVFVKRREPKWKKVPLAELQYKRLFDYFVDCVFDGKKIDAKMVKCGAILYLTVGLRVQAAFNLQDEARDIIDHESNLNRQEGRREDIQLLLFSLPITSDAISELPHWIAYMRALKLTTVDWSTKFDPTKVDFWQKIKETNVRIDIPQKLDIFFEGSLTERDNGTFSVDSPRLTELWTDAYNRCQMRTELIKDEEFRYQRFFEYHFGIVPWYDYAKANLMPDDYDVEPTIQATEVEIQETTKSEEIQETTTLEVEETTEDWTTMFDWTTLGDGSVSSFDTEAEAVTVLNATSATETPWSEYSDTEADTVLVSEITTSGTDRPWTVEGSTEDSLTGQRTSATVTGKAFNLRRYLIPGIVSAIVISGGFAFGAWKLGFFPGDHTGRLNLKSAHDWVSTMPHQTALPNVLTRVLGILFALAILGVAAVCIWCYCRKKKKKAADTSEEREEEEDAQAKGKPTSNLVSSSLATPSLAVSKATLAIHGASPTSSPASQLSKKKLPKLKDAKAKVTTKAAASKQRPKSSPVNAAKKK